MKRNVVIVLMLLLPLFVFAQEVNPNLQSDSQTSVSSETSTLKLLQTALKNKKITEVKSLLENSGEKETKECEALILDTAKKAVEKDDLDFAYSLSEIVLMYNFDNLEAQQLYTSIDKARKSKAELLAKEAEKAKQKKEDEERKRQLEEYNAMKKQEAEKKEAYQKSISSIDFNNFPIYASISPVALDFTSSEIADEYNSKNGINTKYGAGAFIDLGFKHPYILADLHLNYEFLFADFGDKGAKSSLMTRLTLGSPIISNYVRLSLGYNLFNYINDKNSVLLRNVSAPTLGFGIEKVKIGKNFSFDLFSDINTLTFIKESKIDFGFDIDLSMRYVLPVQLFKKNIYIQNNTYFNGYAVSQKWEQSINTSFSVGVAINE